MNKRMKNIFLCLLAMVIVLSPLHVISGYSRAGSVSGADWICWGANYQQTFSMPDDLAPDIETMEELWVYKSNHYNPEFLFKNNNMYVLEYNAITCVSAFNGDVVWRRDGVFFYDYDLTDYGVFAFYGNDDDQFVYSTFDFLTGDVLWEVEMEKNIYNPDSYSNGKTVFVESYQNYYSDPIFLCFDAESGKLEKSIPLEGFFTYVVFDDDSLIGKIYTTPSKIVSINLESGEQEWEMVTDDDYKASYIIPLYNEKMFISAEYNPEDGEAERKGAILYSISSKTGEVLEKFELTCYEACFEGIYKDTLFVTDYCKGLVAYDVDSFEEKWVFEHSGSYSSVAISNDMIFFSAVIGDERSFEFESNLYCVDVNSGEELWRYDKPGRFTSVKISNNKFYFNDRPEEKKIVEGLAMPIRCFGIPPASDVVFSVEVSPKVQIVNYNDKIELTAKAYNKDKTLLRRKVVWTVDPPTAGEISRDGVFSPSGNEENCIVMALIDGVYSFSKIRIVMGERIDIKPEVIAIRPGNKQVFKASLLNRAGKEIPEIPFEWSISNDEIGTLTEDGEFTASEVGGVFGDVICSFGNLKCVSKVNVLDTSMETAISFDNLNLMIDDPAKKTFEIRLKNNVDVEITANLNSFGRWMKIDKEQLIIQPGEEEAIVLTVNPSVFKPGYVYIGKVKASWEGGVAFSQITVLTPIDS